MTRDPATEILQRCISRCAAADDERGRWRPEELCAAELWRLNPAARPFGPGEIDRDCAAAARRIGAWIAGVGRA
jgi:hypothetical protein